VDFCGAIFYHKNYVHSDGSSTPKLFIVLNSPTKEFQNFLSVVTTSRKNNNPDTPGCNINRSLYFIPKGKEFFEKPTWVQLKTLTEWHKESVLDDNNYEMMSKKLSRSTLDDLKTCLYFSEYNDISSLHRKALWTSAEELRLKFKAPRYS